MGGLCGLLRFFASLCDVLEVRAKEIQDTSVCLRLVRVTNPFVPHPHPPLFLPEKPNYFIKELSDLKTEESGTTIFSFQCEKCSYTVIWRKGIAELRPGRKYEMAQKGRDLQLSIRNLEKSDSDVYTCDIGDAQSRAKLVVQGMCESHMTAHPVSPLPRHYPGRICTFMAGLWGCSCLA